MTSHSIWADDSLAFTNVVAEDDLTRGIQSACQLLFDQLALHCGPRARDAVVPQCGSDRRTWYDVHTKDGISIVDWMRFPESNHAANYAHRQVSYLGRRVDSICHDGTTTTMMLAAHLLGNLRAEATPGQFQRALNQVLGQLRQALDAVTVSVDAAILDTVTATGETTVDEVAAKARAVRHQLIRQQALIASKGDQGLADAIAAVLATLPPAVYGQYALGDSKVETEQRWLVEHQEYDVVFAGESYPRDRNHRSGTQFLSEDCDLYLTENDIVGGNIEAAFLLAELHAIIKDPASLERDFVIVAPKFDPSWVEATVEFNLAQGLGPKVILLTQSIGHISQINHYIKMARVVAGVPSLVEVYGDPAAHKTSIIRHAKVWQAFHQIHLGNLYPRDGGLYHPAYCDPTLNPAYTSFRQELEETLQDSRTGHKAAAYDGEYVKFLVDIYLQLVCQRPAKLVVGGTTHEHLANKSVAQDAMGAVISMLEDGFVLGGLRHLLLALEDTSFGDPLAQHIALTMKQGLLAILNIVYDGDRRAREVEHYRTSDASKYVYHVIDGDGQVVVTSLAEALGDELRVLIQPAAGYRELLRRLGELLPMACTSASLIDLKQ